MIGTTVSLSDGVDEKSGRVLYSLEPVGQSKGSNLELRSSVSFRPWYVRTSVEHMLYNIKSIKHTKRLVFYCVLCRQVCINTNLDTLTYIIYSHAIIIHECIILQS